MKTTLLILLAAQLNFAQDSSTGDKKKGANKASDFRCERYMTRDLSILKAKLVENCDLNKPFSTSLSVFTGDDTYLYCCHSK